jgi:hypothetical protein
MRFFLCTTKIPIIVFLTCHVPTAQRFALGVKGGVRATDDLGQPNAFINFTSESRRYIVGPTTEVHLRSHFSFELDALYRRFGYRGWEGQQLSGQERRERANSWEFPMILKYRFGVPLDRPPSSKRVPVFVGLGYAPRIIHGMDVSSGFYLSGPPCCYTSYYSNVHSDTRYPTTHGVVFSGGLNLNAGHVRISPELRFVHWSAPFLDDTLRGSEFTSQRNEIFFMLGLSWH